MADGSAEHSPAVPRDISGGGGPTDRRTSWSPAPTLSFTVAEASDTGPGQVRRALPVSVSVSFSAVHGRSDETEAGGRSHDRPPMNGGERPRTEPRRPPTDLESVLGQRHCLAPGDPGKR
jgi:hypothetical protein